MKEGLTPPLWLRECLLPVVFRQDLIDPCLREAAICNILAAL
jgi:hypothetical protein